VCLPTLFRARGGPGPCRPKVRDHFRVLGLPPDADDKVHHNRMFCGPCQWMHINATIIGPKVLNLQFVVPLTPLRNGEQRISMTAIGCAVPRYGFGAFVIPGFRQLPAPD